VGVVVGTQYTGAPAAAAVVALLQRQSVTHVRLLGGAGDGALLAAMAGTGMEVMVTLPNAQLLGVGESNATARNWARANVQAYLPATNITAVCVGTDVLTSDPNAALVLLPALRFLRAALLSSNLSAHVRLSTTLHPSLILDAFPPSQAFFNKSWTPTVLSPLLDFLASSSSFLLLDLLSYDIYRAAGGAVSLDYALLNPLTPAQLVVDPNTLFQYRSLFDAVLDSAYFALARLNRSDLPVVVSAAGWPSAGGPDASPDNAALHNSNLIARVLNGSGTPKRPHSPLDAFLFELFDEDAAPASPTLRSYGLFNASSPSLAPVYTLRLSGSGPLLANDTSARLFCVAKPGADPDALQIALDWACAGAGGRANCSAIQPGQLCYLPDSLPAHASYAFNSYYQARGRADGSCDFGGVATVSTTDPGTLLSPLLPFPSPSFPFVFLRVSSSASLSLSLPP
jgi:hypothetical protein